MQVSSESVEISKNYAYLNKLIRVLKVTFKMNFNWGIWNFE